MNKIITSLLSLVLCFVMASCGGDEPDKPSSGTSGGSTPGGSTTQRITKPSFDKDLSTSDLASFSIRVRFKTGGDKESNLSATVHWNSYRSKPSKTPSKKDLTKTESMRQYGSATYHNTGSKKGMTESIVFDKSHAGYGGSYIYYYVECTNSKGSASSAVSYFKAKGR